MLKTSPQITSHTIIDTAPITTPTIDFTSFLFFTKQTIQQITPGIASSAPQPNTDTIDKINPTSPRVDLFCWGWPYGCCGDFCNGVPWNSLPCCCCLSNSWPKSSFSEFIISPFHFIFRSINLEHHPFNVLCLLIHFHYFKIYSKYNFRSIAIKLYYAIPSY